MATVTGHWAPSRLLHVSAVVLLSFGLQLSYGSTEGIVAKPTRSHFVEEESRLISDLLKRVNKMARPVKHPNDTVIIKFGLGLLSLDAVDETLSTMTTTVWTRQLWRDDSMRWNPSNYGGIWMVHMPADLIWSPSLTVYNSKDPLVYLLESPVTIYSTGQVVWIPQRRITSMCELDLTYFPFDTQECSIKISSWTYDGSQVVLQFYEDQPYFDTREYSVHIGWDVVNQSAMKNVKYYTCCKEPFPDLTFTLRIRRRPVIYSFVYIGPVVLLALATPFMFLLPPGDGQRVALGTGLLVCITLFFISIERTIRADHHNIPRINMYYMAQYSLVTISLANTTVVANIAARATWFKQPPNILKKVFLDYLGRFLCVSYPSYDGMPLLNDSGSTTKLSSYSGETNEKISSGPQEWALIAKVIDRLLLLIYTILIVLVPLSILLHGP